MGWQDDKLMQNCHGITITALKCAILKYLVKCTTFFSLNTLYLIYKQHIDYFVHVANLHVKINNKMMIVIHY